MVRLGKREIRDDGVICPVYSSTDMQYVSTAMTTAAATTSSSNKQQQ